MKRALLKPEYLDDIRVFLYAAVNTQSPETVGVPVHTGAQFPTEELCETVFTVLQAHRTTVGVVIKVERKLFSTKESMPKTRQQKSITIDRLVKEFKNAKSVVFADYQGLTVAKVDELRKNMRAANVSYLVAKKSLMTKAAKDAGFDMNAKSFPGMLGAAFAAEDEIAPAKVLGDMAKKASLKLVGGIFEGVVVGQDKVIALSKLPSKKELLGQVVGTMYAPVSAFVRALNALKEQKEKATV